MTGSHRRPRRLRWALLAALAALATPAGLAAAAAIPGATGSDTTGTASTWSSSDTASSTTTATSDTATSDTATSDTATIAVTTTTPVTTSVTTPVTVVTPAPRLVGRPGVTVRVGRPLAVAPLAPGYLGMSLEYQILGQEIGTPQNPDLALDGLIADLGQGRPHIRVGGDSADHAWLPGPGVRPNPGLSYPITPEWLTNVAAFARRTGARFDLGINLEDNDPALAAREGEAMLAHLGSAIEAWEVGNEPDLYAVFPWYTITAGHRSVGFFTRPRTYALDTYLHEFDGAARALPGRMLAGPSLGPPARWLADLPQIIRAEPRMGIVTYHAYPLNCYAPSTSPEYASLGNLLSRTATVGLADGLAQYVAEAHAAHRRFRIDEMNSSSCGGATGVSNVFGSALWMTDVLFAFAERGVDGVDVQDFDGARYAEFDFSHRGSDWEVGVQPDFFGMLLFADAAPPGSRLLAAGTSGPDAAALQAYAARTPANSIDHGAETVTLTNDSPWHNETVAVEAPGATAPAELVRMLAPSVHAMSGITIGGVNFGAVTHTGKLIGIPTATRIVPSGAGRYLVSVPAGSAAVLVLPR